MSSVPLSKPPRPEWEQSIDAFEARIRALEATVAEQARQLAALQWAAAVTAKPAPGAREVAADARRRRYGGHNPFGGSPDEGDGG